VRSIYATWGRGDFSSTAWADPEIEFSIVGGADPGSWTGVVGMAQGWRQWLSAWDDYNAEADEYSELDDERVLVSGRMSGAERRAACVETEFANLLHLRNHKVSRLCLYSDRDRALADLGLAE
jgi:ketosteroid isomerase-like protein